MNQALTAAWSPFAAMGLAMPTAPSIDYGELNRRAKDGGLTSRADAPIVFCDQAGRLSAVEYERHIFDSGRVPSRAHLHDALNACCWLRYPNLKASLNYGHCRDSAEVPTRKRSRRRDAITLLDEAGVLIVSSDPTLLEALAAHQWQVAFWQRRQAWANVGVFVIGHGLLEQLHAPYIGLTGKAALIHAHPADSLAEVEAKVAKRVDDGAFLKSPSQLSPLPILGIPGWWSANEAPDFYHDEGYFRPAPDAATPTERVLGLGSPA